MGRYIPKETLTAGNEDNTPNVNENEQPVVWSNDLETPEEVFELESDGEHENAVQNIETLDEAQQALESLREALVSVGTENFNKGTVILLDNGLNQILNKFDLSASDIGVASVEDMESNPIEAFNISVEKISDTAKAVGNKIVEWIRELLKKLKAFLGEIFNTVKYQKEKAEKLFDAGKHTKYQANETITLPALFSTGINPAEIKMLTATLLKVHAVDASAITKVLQDGTAEEIKKTYAEEYSKFFNDDIEMLAGGVFASGSAKDGKLKLSLNYGNQNKKPETKTIKNLSVNAGLDIARELIRLATIILQLDEAKGKDYAATARIIELHAKVMSDESKKGAIMNSVATVTTFERALMRHASKVLQQGNNVLVQIFKPRADPDSKQIEHKKAA